MKNKAPEIPTHLTVRIDAKLNYLLDLASNLTDKTKTQYLEAVLNDSFKRVFVDDLEDEEVKEAIAEAPESPVGSLYHYGDVLYDPSPAKRLQMRLHNERLMNQQQDAAIAAYIESSDSYSVAFGGSRKWKFEAIERDWDKIKAAALL